MPNQPPETIGSRLLHALRVRKMTQSDLARALGISPASVSDIIHGKTIMPASDTLVKLEEILTITGRWFITGEGPGPIDDQEARVRQMYRKASPATRAAMLAALKGLADADQEKK